MILLAALPAAFARSTSSASAYYFESKGGGFRNIYLAADLDKLETNTVSLPDIPEMVSDGAIWNRVCSIRTLRPQGSETPLPASSKVCQISALDTDWCIGPDLSLQEDNCADFQVVETDNGVLYMVGDKALCLKADWPIKDIECLISNDPEKRCTGISPILKSDVDIANPPTKCLFNFGTTEPFPLR